MSYERLTVFGTIRAVMLIPGSGPGKKPFLRLSVAVERLYRKVVKTEWYSVYLFSNLIEGKDISHYKVGRAIIAEGTPTTELFEDKTTKEIRVDQMLKAITWPELLPPSPQFGPSGKARIHIAGKLGAIEMYGDEADPKRYAKLSVVVDKPRAKGGSVWYSVFMFQSLLKGHDLDRYRVGRTLLVEGNPENAVFTDERGEARVDRTIKATSWPDLA